MIVGQQYWWSNQSLKVTLIQVWNVRKLGHIRESSVQSELLLTTAKIYMSPLHP